MTVFSSLNVESARLARHGNPEAAARVARAAAELEAGPEFAQLQRIMSELPIHDAERLVDGVLPEAAPDQLTTTLKAVARLTEQCRANELPVTTSAEVIAGRVAEVHEEYVVLVLISGPTTMLPRWMAVAAQRDMVGDLLALVMDKLDDGRAVIEAVPAIDVDNDIAARRFTPFGRNDPRVLSLTKADERLLAGEPQPLRILVPVLIDA
ncbi:MAG TPA: hypothetical protein VEF71_17605 [Streptosporangiaceae bacterium]|nr:hypothetical protein [Streptosporangiaceae bacterium]